MKFTKLRIAAIVAAMSAVPVFAATPVIGVASALGSFTVNSATVNGNANVLDGSELRTDKASSQVLLQSGPSLTLATNSSATVFNDHLVLSQGSARLDNMSKYAVEASGYRVVPDQPASQAIVRLNNGAVEVGSLSGAVKVFDAKGAMLTRVGAGTASSFTPRQSGASPSTGASGTVTTKVAVASLIASLAAVGIGAAALVNSNNNPSSASP